MFVNTLFQFLKHLDDLVEELCKGGMELSWRHQMCVRSEKWTDFEVKYGNSARMLGIRVSARDHTPSDGASSTGSLEIRPDLSPFCQWVSIHFGIP